MSKPRTRKIAASALKPGMTIIIPAQRGIVTVSTNVDKTIPSLSKGILLVELNASSGPWKGTTGKVLVLECDTLEVEVAPAPLRRLAKALHTWLAKYVW